MLAVVDIRLSQTCESTLRKSGISNIVRLPAFEKLAPPVASHPDMLIYKSKGRLLCHSEYLKVAADELEFIARSSDLTLTPSNELICSEYPHDILFNALDIGGKVFCRAPYISSLIRDAHDIYDVRQGYAKCSVAKVSENAAITSDPSLCTALSENGISVLYITKGSILLDGYDYGFIGGACGLYSSSLEQKLFFCGNIELHPDGKRIIDFCTQRNVSVISLSDDCLTDMGSILFF